MLAEMPGWDAACRRLERNAVCQSAKSQGHYSLVQFNYREHLELYLGHSCSNGMLMFKKTFLSLSCALALGAVAAPALASSKFFLVVPLNAQSQAQEPVESITVSLAGAALPKATVNQAYRHSLQDYLSVTGDPALDKAATRWSLTEGALPAGLALDAATGAVAGTPTAKTTSPASFTVLVSTANEN